MSIQLHEWFDLFCKKNNLNSDPDSMNEGTYLLNYLINDQKTGIYSDRYDNVKCLTLVEFYKFWKNLENEGRLTDLLYDKTTGYVIINCRQNSSISHEYLAAHIFESLEPNVKVTDDHRAELFIDKYGFIRSSASGYGKWARIVIGNNLKLTSDEKLAFKDFEFISEDMS